MKALEEQEQAKKVRLENVTNHKEYQSIKTELDAIKAQQHTHEKELLEAWAVLEAATKAYEQKKEVQAKQYTTVQDALIALTAKRVELAQRVHDAMRSTTRKRA